MKTGFGLRASGFGKSHSGRLGPAAMASALLAVLAGCMAPSRNLAAVRPDKAGCATLQQWAQDKSFAKPAHAGESSVEEDGREAALCWHREGDDSGHRFRGDEEQERCPEDRARETEADERRQSLSRDRITPQKWNRAPQAQEN